MPKGKIDARDFYLLASRIADAKPSSATKWWEMFYEVIVRECYLTGVVYLPNIGYITLKRKKETLRKTVNPDGTVEYNKIPARDYPVVKFDDDFINDINMTGVTKNYRLRLKNGALSVRDKERERRARELLSDNEVENAKAQKRRREELFDEFEERMKDYRDKYDQRQLEAEFSGDID